MPGRTPHCGQPRRHQQWVLTHGPCRWRCRKSSRRRFSTWVNSRRKRPTRQLLRDQPGDDPHCGQPRRHPSLAHTHEKPGRNYPAGRDLPTGGHIGRGASTHSHDDVSCSAEVEYRTSSTPACTDGLDLHHSTNNTPTTTRDRSTLRTADNPSNTHHWCAPTNISEWHPHKPTIHLGKQRPKMGGSSTFTKTAPANIRNADNHDGTHHWRTPTNYRVRHPRTGTP